MRYFLGEPQPWEEVSHAEYAGAPVFQRASISEDGFDLVSVRAQALPLHSMESLLELMRRGQADVDDGGSDPDNPSPG